MNEQMILEQIKTRYLYILGDKLVGIYVHGSLAFGCFHYDTSDIDFLVVVKSCLTVEEKTMLISVLLDLDDYCPTKGLEMSVVLASVCNPFVYPTPYELHYSNAYRRDYKIDLVGTCLDMMGTDKDLAAHVMVINTCGICLYGKGIQEVFGAVDAKYMIDSIQEDLCDVFEQAKENPVYCLLNACRACAYVLERKVLSKEEGVEWAYNHFPERFHLLLSMAKESYQTGKVFNWGYPSIVEVLQYAMNIINSKEVMYQKIDMVTDLGLPYSLHDQRIVRYEIEDANLRLYFEHGLFEIENLQYVDGYLEFEGVDWDFCNMYLMDVENEGPFNGYKYNLQDFIAKGSEPLEIIDEVYGYHRCKYSGVYYEDDRFKEFLMEIFYQKGSYVVKVK
ncbi:MAG: DUF4111 domain-containing protein [Erysipelotrichaceae bacterium]|nr:DUF4111 domain-containing protein [Erysipelotrichaceae bacterium]